MKKGLILTSVFATILSVGLISPTSAHANFDFGSCINPKVEVSQVNYGKDHGVVGKNSTYSGVDKIYKFENGNVMQCLCPDNGEGIQTNWLKAGDLSQKEIDRLKHEGWHYVITGSAWGLEDCPYLAKNIHYTCKAKEVKETKVKGLASTGNTVAIYGLLIAGAFSLAAGLLLKRFSK